MSKKKTFTILFTLCFALVIVAGAFAVSPTAWAATDVRTQFTESVLRLNRSLGDDSPAAFIPLLNERSGMALLLRLDAESFSSLSSFSKSALASMLLTLITDNTYLALDVNNEMQYIVNKDNNPVFDLQPIFDLLTGSVEDIMTAVSEKVTDGTYQQFNIGDNIFADQDQATQYGSDLGFLFGQTTLYYFNNAGRPIAIDFFLTMAGGRDAMLKLSDIAQSVQNYFRISEIRIVYKEINLQEQTLSCDFLFTANIESRDEPDLVAVFATLIASLTEREEFKQQLVDAVNSYLQTDDISTLKQLIDQVTAAEGMEAMKKLSKTSYGEILQSLNIQSQKLEQIAQKNRAVVSFFKIFTDRIVMSNGGSNFAEYETTEGTYLFDINSADENGNKSILHVTVGLFEPTVKNLERLRTQVFTARGLDKSNYTNETWEAMMEVLQEAEGASEELTQSEIDEITYRLEKAIKNLVVIPPVEPTPPNFTWLYVTLSAIAAVAAAVVATLLVIRRRKQFEDNVPVVEYDPDEDAFDDSYNDFDDELSEDVYGDGEETTPVAETKSKHK